MKTNATINEMLARRSIRKYETRMPEDDVIEAVVRAGQQAPFAGQLGSVLLKRRPPVDESEAGAPRAPKQSAPPSGIPWNAPLLFTICIDMHRMELVMEKRGWRTRAHDLNMLLFGVQDAILMSENMVMAAESLGMGSCFLGGAPFRSERIIEEYGLPKRVFPVVQLTMGYPAEDPPPRPRYPLSFHLFEERYPDFTDDDIEAAMKQMDDGYLEEDYYRTLGAKIKLDDAREETFTFDDYSWTEHMCRKWGQWLDDAEPLLEQLEKCGFELRRMGEGMGADENAPD